MDTARYDQLLDEAIELNAVIGGGETMAELIRIIEDIKAEQSFQYELSSTYTW